MEPKHDGFPVWNQNSPFPVHGQVQRQILGVSKGLFCLVIDFTTWPRLKFTDPQSSKKWFLLVGTPLIADLVWRSLLVWHLSQILFLGDGNLILELTAGLWVASYCFGGPSNTPRLLLTETWVQIPVWFALVYIIYVDIYILRII